MAEIKLGSLIDDYGLKRDAVHVAVTPVIADEDLSPGQHVGITNGKYAVTTADHLIGIVDPFLTEPIKEGQKFWLFMYPNTVKSLRHDWSHPNLDDADEDDWGMGCGC